MMNISPIAKGKLERICNTFLLNFLTTPEGPFWFFELAGTFPLLISSLSCVSGGGEDSDKTIFCDNKLLFFPLFLRLQLMVNEKVLWWWVWILLYLNKGWKVGTLRRHWFIGLLKDIMWHIHAMFVFVFQFQFEGLCCVSSLLTTTVAVTLSLSR